MLVLVLALMSMLMLVFDVGRGVHAGFYVGSGDGTDALAAGGVGVDVRRQC